MCGGVILRGPDGRIEQERIKQAREPRRELGPARGGGRPGRWPLAARGAPRPRGTRLIPLPQLPDDPPLPTRQRGRLLQRSFGGGRGTQPRRAEQKPRAQGWGRGGGSRDSGLSSSSQAHQRPMLRSCPSAELALTVTKTTVVVGDGGGGSGGSDSSRTGVSAGGSSAQASGSRSRSPSWSLSSSELDEAVAQQRGRLRSSSSSTGAGVQGGGRKRAVRADGDCSSGSDGAPWRRSRSGHSGRHDEADDGRGEDGGGDADGWHSESWADWADSDGSAGMPPDFDSDDRAGAADSPSPEGYAGGIRVSEGGAESYTVLPWSAAGGFEGRPARSSGGGGAVAEEWAGFPGPLPPVEPTTRTGAAVRVVGDGACDPMGLCDAEWAAMLPPPPAAAGRADAD